MYAARGMLCIIVRVSCSHPELMDRVEPRSTTRQDKNIAKHADSAPSLDTLLSCGSLLWRVCPNRFCGLWVGLTEVRRTKVCNKKLIKV